MLRKKNNIKKKLSILFNDLKIKRNEGRENGEVERKGDERDWGNKEVPFEFNSPQTSPQAQETPLLLPRQRTPITQPTGTLKIEEV